jgi:hypothetical protein
MNENNNISSSQNVSNNNNNNLDQNNTNNNLHQLSGCYRSRNFVLRISSSSSSLVASAKSTFLCRHTYPPATLTPSALRRIDATAYYALTAKWEVVLTPVLVLRNPVQAIPFGIISRGEGSEHITLFLSAEFHADSRILSSFSFLTF